MRTLKFAGDSLAGGDGGQVNIGSLTYSSVYHNLKCNSTITVPHRGEYTCLHLIEETLHKGEVTLCIYI